MAVFHVPSLATAQHLDNRQVEGSIWSPTALEETMKSEAIIRLIRGMDRIIMSNHGGFHAHVVEQLFIT